MSPTNFSVNFTNFLHFHLDTGSVFKLIFNIHTISFTNIQFTLNTLLLNGRLRHKKTRFYSLNTLLFIEKNEKHESFDEKRTGIWSIVWTREFYSTIASIFFNVFFCCCWQKGGDMVHSEMVFILFYFVNIVSKILLLLLKIKNWFKR